MLFSALDEYEAVGEMAREDGEGVGGHRPLPGGRTPGPVAEIWHN